MARTYDQYCGLAHALDLLGERWSLLVVRNLLAGPQRYTDLLEGLPGISTNLLSDRLKALEGAEVVERRTLPPPAPATVYELTPYGRDLEPAVTALAFWGVRSMPTPRRTTAFQPRWAVLSLKQRFAAVATPGLAEIYELRVGDECFRIAIQDGDVDVRQGVDDRADARLVTDTGTFYALASGRLSTGDALGSGRLSLDGEPDTVARVARALGAQRSLGAQGREPGVAPRRGGRR